MLEKLLIDQNKNSQDIYINSESIQLNKYIVTGLPQNSYFIKS